MTTIRETGSLALLLLAVTARPAFGQSAGAAPSPAPSPNDAVKIHAFVSASYQYNFNRPPAGTNQLRVFDFDDNSFKIDVVELSVERSATKPRASGFRLDLIAGASIPKVTAASGLFRDPQTGHAQDFDLKQGYITYIAPIGSGLRFDAGKFVTALGAEVIEGWDGYNDNASRSLLFGYAIPTSHTGLRLSYALTPMVSGMVTLVNGWDNVKDNNTGKTVHGQIGLTPTDRISIVLNVITGPEQNANNRDLRTVFDLVASWKTTKRTTWGINVDVGHEGHAAPAGEDAVWRGTAAYFRHAWESTLAIALRGEVFSDVNGARTGVAQRVSEFTVTPELRLSPQALVRVELRIDRSTQSVFDGRGGARQIQPTFGFNALYFF